MLKNIPECIPPELMKCLMEMGHGDEIVIGDINFPQQSMGKRAVYCKGIKGPEMLEAIMKLLPLDIFVDDPVVLMETGELYKGTPPIWPVYEKIIKENDTCNAFHGFKFLERFAFYERAKQAFVIVGTSEPSLYAPMILKKGAIGDFGSDD